MTGADILTLVTLAALFALVALLVHGIRHTAGENKREVLGFAALLALVGLVIMAEYAVVREWGHHENVMMPFVPSQPPLQERLDTIARDLLKEARK